MKNYKLIASKQPQGCRVQHREYSWFKTKKQKQKKKRKKKKQKQRTWSPHIASCIKKERKIAGVLGISSQNLASYSGYKRFLNFIN